ncbi:hypothetical protein SEA_CECE_260 [Microbacterium phage Cece]|nr:hypothetical protein SEA_CECE_260 [Microbacterium phage Cece]
MKHADEAMIAFALKKISRDELIEILRELPVTPAYVEVQDAVRREAYPGVDVELFEEVYPFKFVPGPAPYHLSVSHIRALLPSSVKFDDFLRRFVVEDRG